MDWLVKRIVTYGIVGLICKSIVWSHSPADFIGGLQSCVGYCTLTYYRGYDIRGLTFRSPLKRAKGRAIPLNILEFNG